MIIHTRFNGRYLILEKNATAGELIVTLVRALDMVVKDIAGNKNMDPEDLMNTVISILEASAKSDELLPEFEP